MINSRDSFNDFNQNEKKVIEVPYNIGTIVESKENSNVLAKIIQYRVIVKGLEIIYVGLCNQVNKLEKNDNKEGKIHKIEDEFIAAAFSSSIDFEITTQELDEKWRKTKKRVIIQINDEFKEREPNNIYKYITPPESREFVRKLVKTAENQNIKNDPYKYYK